MAYLIFLFTIFLAFQYLSDHVQKEFLSFQFFGLQKAALLNDYIEWAKDKKTAVAKWATENPKFGVPYNRQCPADDLQNPAEGL